VGKEVSDGTGTSEEERFYMPIGHDDCHLQYHVPSRPSIIVVAVGRFQHPFEKVDVF
jgi:hypothetical protein